MHFLKWILILLVAFVLIILAVPFLLFAKTFNPGGTTAFLNQTGATIRFACRTDFEGR